MNQQLANYASTLGQLTVSRERNRTKLSPAIEQALYRIAQEAIANVVKHAHANTLAVGLYCKDQVELIISDDGVGISVEKTTASQRFGLVGMRERAKLIGGTLTIHTHLNQGTTIKVTL